MNHDDKDEAAGSDGSALETIEELAVKHFSLSRLALSMDLGDKMTAGDKEYGSAVWSALPRLFQLFFCK